MTSDRYLRGSTKRCPKCFSSAVAYSPTLQHEGYGPGLASCQNCKCLWEPFAPEQIWDTTDPHCSFREPCNNCAFRRGSPEQADPEKWQELLDQVAQLGANFYCHKGVPIEPGAENGFAYPMKNGKPDEPKLRMCRGYLNYAFSSAAEKRRQEGSKS